jgi:hypothetical protein
VSWVGTVSSQPRWLGWVQPKIFNNNIIILKKEKEKEKEIKFFEGHFKNICGSLACFSNNFA